MKPIKLKITIKLLTPLHVGGDPGTDTNMAYILRGADGKAYYPGTAFKGKVRDYALQLQKDNCQFPGDCVCAVCRLFGGEGNARGSLLFSNFHAEGDQATDFRVGNSIDRFRRVAEDEKLFTMESAAISELFGYITGNADDDDVELLKESIKLIRQIGGNTSRGFGWIEEEIEINDETIDSMTKDETTKAGGSAVRVRVKLSPKSPLLIGTHTTQSNFRDTRSIIPGAVLRAALARAICVQDGTDDPSAEGIRYMIPKDGETLFPNLRQAFSELRFSALNPEIQPEPHPITARKCKFNEEHNKVDTLVAALSSSEGITCPDCGERLEKIDSYQRLQTITSTHSEMDKYRGTSKDARLYTVRAIAPNAADFYGTISGEIDIDELSLLLRSPLRVGAMTTSGFGECEISFEPVLEMSDSGMLDRIKKFNSFIGGNEILVPITLMSDAIVDLDEPDDGDYTKAYASLVFPFELERVITKPRVWRGFNTSKPYVCQKEAQFLLQAGSALVIRVDALDSLTIEKLLRFECEGIGNETNDGYGAVRIAHDAHMPVKGG